MQAMNKSLRTFQGYPPGVKMPRKTPAMWFDGNTYVHNSAAMSPNLNLISGSSIFFRLCSLKDSTSYNGFLLDTKAGLSTSKGFIIFHYSYLLRLAISAPFTVLSLCTISPYVSYNVILNLDFLSNQILVYRNGSLSNILSCPVFSDVNNTVNLSIGHFYNTTTPSYIFNGMLADIAIQDGLATEEQIASYQRGAMPDTPYVYDTFNNIINAGGSLYGTPEDCFVHRNGAIIRTDGTGQRYIVE